MSTPKRAGIAPSTFPVDLSSAVGYEVYVRSFCDSNDDGIGDLAGVRERLDYLVELGVQLVWLTPFYPSPMEDFGYDVADYCDVDPRFGTLDDLDALTADAHARGVAVIIDIVPNHTSNRHPWFQRALADPQSPERGYYIFRDPGPDGGPPNNWVSYFGGPAWTFDPASGQYYLHLFLPEQPDLNWSNPAVADEFDAILNFWLDRGVDGFRIDVAHALVKDPELRSNPQRHEPPPDPTPTEVFDSFDHLYDIDQPGVVDVYRRWKSLVAPRGAILVGEVYLADAHAVRRYVGDDALDLSFYFPMLRERWASSGLRDSLADAVDELSRYSAWPLSSHDDPRAPTRLGGGRSGADRALSLFAVLAFLPGVPFLYQGDELGLGDLAVAPENVVDPVAVRNANPSAGRDPVRTPFPWNDGVHNGFSAAVPWLIAPDRPAEDTAAAQMADTHSLRAGFKNVIAERRRIGGDLPDVVEWHDIPGALAFSRGPVTVMVNVTDGPTSIDVTGEVTVATADYSSGPGEPRRPASTPARSSMHAPGGSSRRIEVPSGCTVIVVSDES